MENWTKIDLSQLTQQQIIKYAQKVILIDTMHQVPEDKRQDLLAICQSLLRWCLEEITVLEDVHHKLEEELHEATILGRTSRPRSKSPVQRQESLEQTAEEPLVQNVVPAFGVEDYLVMYEASARIQKTYRGYIVRRKFQALLAEIVFGK